MDPDRIDGWMVDAFVESHESAPEEIVLDLDATETRSMASRKAGSFTVTTATTVISRCTSSRGSICCAPGCGVPISMGPRDRRRNWNGSSAGFGRAGRRSRSSSGPTRAFAGMTCFHQFVQDQATLSSAPKMRLFGLFRHGFEGCVGACKHGLRLFHRLRRVLTTAGLMPRYPPLVGSDDCRLPLPYCGILSVGTAADSSRRHSPKPYTIERKKSLDIDVYQAEPI